LANFKPPFCYFGSNIPISEAQKLQSLYLANNKFRYVPNTLSFHFFKKRVQKIY
jgi:hypothetical protein